MRMLMLFFALLVMTHRAQAEDYCTPLKNFQTQYKINLEMAPPQFDFTKSHAQLTSSSKEKILKKWATTQERKVWIENGYVAGVARGGSGLTSQMELMGAPIGNSGQYYCPFFQTININIFYETVIFVANDFKPGSCDFKITMEHEFKHHRTNERIIEKYMEKLQNDLPQMTGMVESFGFVDKNKVSQRFAFMKQSLNDAIEVYDDAMSKEMEHDNGLIDSLDEYKANAARCVNGVDTQPYNDPMPLSAKELAQIPAGYIDPNSPYQFPRAAAPVHNP